MRNKREVIKELKESQKELVSGKGKKLKSLKDLEKKGEVRRTSELSKIS